MEGKVKRIEWIDIMKGIAIFLVILDHSSLYSSDFLIRTFPLYFYKLLYVSVPWFFLLFGYTSMLSFESGHSWLDKSIRFVGKRGKYVVYYVLAATFAYVWIYNPNPILSSASVSDWFWRLLYFRIINPYYFFFALFQFILMVPFIYLVLRRVTSPLVWILLVIAWYFAMLPFESMHQIPIWYAPWRLPLGGLFSVYLFVGMGMRKFEKWITPIVLQGAVILWAVCFGLLVKSNGGLIIQFVTPFSIVFSITSFMYLVPVVRRYSHTALLRIFSFFGKRSLGIFLLHWIVIYTIMSYSPIKNLWIEYGVTVVGGLAITIGIVEFLRFCTSYEMRRL